MKKIIPFLIAMLLLLTFLSTTQAQIHHEILEQQTTTQTIQERYTNLFQNRQTLRSRIQTLRTSLRNIFSTQHQPNQQNTINPQQTTIQQSIEPISSTPLQPPLAPLNSPQPQYPPIWDTPINTGTVHGYIFMLESNPRINDLPLQPGDWLGGFYIDDNGQRKCGGARMWEGDDNVILTLFGNDGTTPIKDGFGGGEIIQFRYYSWATQKEYIVTEMNYQSGTGYVTNGRWYPTSLSIVLNSKASIDFDAYLTTTPNPICLGDSSQLSAHIFVESTGTYTYSWSSDPPGFTSTLQNPPPVSPTQTTIYKLNVSDGIRYSTHQLPLIVHVNPTVFAGIDAVICENMNHQLQGSAEHYSELLWTTSGDGSFSNPSIYNPVYTPGSQDKTNGHVSLTLTAVPLSPCTIAATDSINLILEPLPQIQAGEDFSVCTNEEVIVNAEASHYSSVLWTTSGSGSFSHPTSVETIYYPSTQDNNAGSVILTLTASSISPCTPSVSDTVTVTFIPGPTITAPAIRRRCENQPISINCVATHYSSILWTTPGDGYFTNPTGLQTTYHPGPQDISNGGLFITVTAFGQGACSVPASQDVELVIVNLPTAHAGNTDTMYSSQSSLQLYGSATNYTNIHWTRIGDGTFSSTTSLETTYYPGANDYATGEFTVILTATPLTYCSTPAVDELTVTIINEQVPSISIQPILDHSTMENQPYSYQVVFDEIDVTEPIIFTLPEKPTGMSISPSSGLIQWNPGFNDRGVHTVTVEASYINYPDVSDMVSYELTVLYVIIDPIADFSYTPFQPLVNEMIQFSCLSTDPDGYITDRSWVFGDGATSNQKDPMHSYSQAGTYLVSLTVTDNDDATDTISKQIQVVLPNEPPVADFSYDPSNPEIGDTVQFNCLSTDPDGYIDSWSWDLGDGTTSSYQNITHVYLTEGTYTVSLTVTDNNGATDTITKEITIEKDDSQSITVDYHLSKGVNFISFDFLPDSLNIEDIFAPLTSAGDLIMLVADNAVGGYYMPAWNVNTLGNNGLVELYRGYRVIIKQDTVLSVSGQLSEEAVSLNLAIGSNFVSFKDETVVMDAVGDLFADDSITMIIDFTNFNKSPLFIRKLHTGVFIGDLEVLQPGHVYLFVATKTCTIAVS